MKRILSKILAAVALVVAVSCSNGESAKALLPNVSGKAGEVIVVIEKADWEGALGNQVREVLAAECPWLAVSEPLYSLANVAPGGFGDIFKYHRNIVIFNIDPQLTSTGFAFKNDVWAAPQVVMQINAHTVQEAQELFTEKTEIILSGLEQAERDRVINNSKLYEERSIAQEVNAIFGGSPHFPIGYKLKSRNENFVWVEDSKQYTTQAILMYRYPVLPEDNFTLDNIIAKRNEILAQNVPGMFENTYMTTSTYFPLSLEYIAYRKRDFAQVRGYWEVQNDYMGGPFVSHSFYSPDGQYIIVAEAFVYAPRYVKRQYLRQVESILYSFEWAKAE